MCVWVHLHPQICTDARLACISLASQAVTTSTLPPCCEAVGQEHSYRKINEGATIAQVVAAAEPRRQLIVLNALGLATELESAGAPGDVAVRAELAAELRAGAKTLAAANTACARPRMTTRPQSGIAPAE